MRSVRTSLFILVSCALAGQAQVNLGDIMRRIPPARPRVPNPAGNNPNNPGRVIPGRGSASADKCQALVAWMSILDREYPQVDFRTTVLDRLAEKALNIFRDEYFQPLFGMPFAQTSDSDRLNHHMTYFRGGCGPNQLSQQELATFQKYKIVVERPFVFGAATYPYQQFMKSLNERQALVQWRDDALRDLAAIPATLPGFDKLEGYWQKGNKDLDNLFPSEKQRFLQRVGEKRKAFTPAMAEQLVQSAAAIPPGLEGAKAIRNLRATYDRYLLDLDPAAKTQMNARLDELLAAAMHDEIGRQKAKLASLPGGIDGALAVVAWQRDFEIEFAGVNPTPEIQALQAQATARRRECLSKGMAEFKTLVQQYPKPGRNGRKADDLLAELFPPHGAQVAESAEYRSALTARLDQMKAAEEAKEAQAKEAKEAKARQAKAAAAASPPVGKTTNAQVHPCDALAGHPGDPGLKGDGVSDQELVPAEAIKQCELAVKQQPKNARFRFQLGRAYWLGKQYDKAVPSLLSAEQMTYAPAYHYLGLAYEQGRVKGEKADKELAADLYKMAIAGGFDADALAVVADNSPEQPALVVEKAEDLDAAVFKEPTWVRALFSGDFDTLNRSRANVLIYAHGMQDFLSIEPNEYDPTCEKLVDPSVSERLDLEQTGVGNGQMNLNTMLSEMKRLMSAPPAMIIANAQRNEQTNQNGVDDMNVLSEDYGSCAGPVVQRVYANLKRFVREKPQPKQFTPAGSSRDRAPLPDDVQGVGDPALLARLRQELQGVAAQGFLVTECTYGAGDKKIVSAHWKNSVPPLSDSLRAAMPGVFPVAMAHCGKHEGYPSAIRTIFQTSPQAQQAIESAPRLSELRAAGPPRMLPPNQQAYSQEVAALVTPLLACKSPREAMPALFWRASLPLIHGAVNWDFLQFVYRYWNVLPVALSACPPSAVNPSLTFKDY